MLKYLKADHSLEKELKLQASTQIISPELKDALEQTIIPNVADRTKNYLYSTLWTVISKNDNQMVGDLCIMGEPNAEGEIEIGYGTYADFRNKGFMTEAVGAIIAWATAQPGVRSVTASTEKNNLASFSVLRKNKFTQVGDTGILLKWKLNLP
ncbi:GNAT family N-acetyltransferase [Gaoshiqia sp. Z1-71]|uniref:GNAT family N-acetyltransferase n=1 Tax=Gaoshiqia hydrogeniformans TaxID=3290090 RepID=UPI003BF8BAE3